MAVNGFTNIVTDGLVLSLDAGNLKSYPTSGTTWTDLSRNGSGTLIGSPTFSSSNSGSIVFNGSTQYVNMGTSGLPLVRNATTLTLCAYFYNTGFSNLQSGYAWSPILVIDSYSSGNSYRKFTLHTSSSNGIQSMSSFFTDGLGNSVGGFSNITVLNNFYYIVATVDSTSNKFYVNGVLASQGAGIVVNSNPLTADFTIGSRINTGYNGYFTGNIYNIQIYNRALSASEVLQNYNATKWRFI